MISVKLIKIKIRLRKGIPLPDAEASSGGRYGSAQPISYEKSGGLAELPIVINLRTKARGASPTPPLHLKTYLLSKGGASSEPDELDNSSDSWRTPNIPLIDDDGALDGHAKEGVGDSDEDGIKNCLDYDSDDDGVYDGTELGVTTPIPERDEIKGTDINSPHFVIDSDPSTTTDPTNEDDDGDGLLDGLEDKNHNGAFDDGETDPKEVDTDEDGLYDGSALNQYDDPGEDSNDNGVVDDDESDPRKKDTDGDNLWDGDEVNPADIKLDKYINRQKSGIWYSSDPFDVDSDGDGLNDDQEIIGWPVRIFWEATLETVKGPYDVFSNPDVKDTDDDGLEDDQEFAYGSDPDEPDTDDDNVNDDVEVERGDNPCGIEGRPPEITMLTVSAVPVVDDYQGTPYLKGWDVTVSISAEDSSGPYKFALKVLGGTPIEVELQEEDEDGYYKTEIDGSATIYVRNDGSWDYCSAFVTTTEDSVGNVLGTYIIGDGLPQYSNNILTLINDGEDAVNHKRDVSGVEYESVPGDIINVEIGQWLAEKIYERLEATMEKIKSTMNWKNSMLLLNYLEGLKVEIDKNDPKSVIEYMKNNELIIEDEQGGTRSDNDEEIDWLVFYLELAVKFMVYSGNQNDEDALFFMDMAQEIYNEDDFDNDGLTKWQEYALNTESLKSDSDEDGIKDGAEIVGYPAKNSPFNYATFYYKTNPMGTVKNGNEKAEGWDTDGDGCHDGDDPIPLDYDMDGDGYINTRTLLTWYYQEKYPWLVESIKRDPNIAKTLEITNEPEYDGWWDLDMDGDGLIDGYVNEPNSDPDDDNDGMTDEYEYKYGNGYPADNGGWQDRWIYNERYAILVGSGGNSGFKDVTGGNFPAFWKDIKELYNTLTDKFNYNPKNVYLMYSSWKVGDEWQDYSNGDPDIDGEAAWDIDQKFDVKDAIRFVGEKITKNDFFLFTIACHSGGSAITLSNQYDGGSAWITYEQIGNEIDNYFGGRWYLPNIPKHYAKMCIILQTCFSAYASNYLSQYKSDRIVIGASKSDELSYTETYVKDIFGNKKSKCDISEHFAFLHEGLDYYLDWWGWQEDYYPGFTLSLWGKSGPNSINYAYEKGYDAARHNYFDAIIGNDGDYTSSPWLDDNANGDADYFDAWDGDIASDTYL